MRKKYTALFFITLASLILLAFVMVPHHHHEEYICFSAVHCQQEANTVPHSHDKSPFNNQEGCVKNLFQTQISRNQSLKHTCVAGHCHHYILTFLMIPALFRFLPSEAVFKNNFFAFYREQFYPFDYIPHFSGRAPPYQA